MYKLPVFETLWAGYEFVWRQRKELADYALLPVLVATIASVFVATTGVGENHWFNSLSGPGDPGPSRFLKYSLLTGGGAVPIVVGTIDSLLQTGLYIAFVVAWSRRHLLGQRSNPLSAVFQWRRSHFRYSAYFIVICALLFIIFTILLLVFLLFVGFFIVDDIRLIRETFTLMASVAIAFSIASVLTTRFWLVFPASAVDDKRLTLRVSRQISKHNSWRIWVVVWLGNTVPFLGFWALYSELVFDGVLVPALQSSIALLFLATLVPMATLYVLTAIGASLLAVIYRQFVDNVQILGETKPA